MTTQLSTKFAALVVALMVNTAMIGGVAYLFSGQVHGQPRAAATAMAGGLAMTASVPAL